jgi:hypothetical protein
MAGRRSAASLPECSARAPNITREGACGTGSVGEGKDAGDLKFEISDFKMAEAACEERA